MIDLERKLLVSGFVQGRDLDGGDIDDEAWISKGSQEMDSLVCAVIHWCINAARAAERKEIDTPGIHALFELKTKGIKWVSAEMRRGYGQ